MDFSQKFQNFFSSYLTQEDLSRLGRNYILTGQYTDIYFPSKGVRYIAVSDGVDSEKGESDIAPFLNILNEMHARQTSKKVKAAIKSRFLNGAHHGAYAPIGYKRHPEFKGKIIPDEDTRWIIEKIFDLAAHGAGPTKIRTILDKEQVPTPGWLNYKKYGYFAHVFENQPEYKTHQWTVSQVKSILTDEVYIGNSVHNKQTTISFKDKRARRKPKEEWYTVPNTHEAIIPLAQWEIVQSHINSRKKPTKSGEIHIFSGLLKCADCGLGMRFTHFRADGKRKEKKFYICGTYNGYGKSRCSRHRIDYDVLYAVVLGRLWHWIALAHEEDDSALMQRLLKSEDEQRTSEKASAKKELSKTKKRLHEIDDLFAKMYEDRAKGKITERNFSMLSTKYQEEQIQLEEKRNLLQEKLDKSFRDSDGAEKWLALVRKYTELTELNAVLLNELIEKILVHEAVKGENGETVQEIEIYYRFVGKIE